MSLHATRAAFDPLSSTGGPSEEAFAAIFEATPPAGTTAPHGDDAAISGSGGVPSSEQDSFMTARSTMSYMTASQGGPPPYMASATAAPQPPPPSMLFPRLPDRTPAAGPAAAGADGGSAGGGDDSSITYNPFMSDPEPPPPPPLPQPLLLPGWGDSNPFAATALLYERRTAVPTDPLSFADVDVNDANAPQTTTAFAMLHDLYDTPDAFTRPAVIAAEAAPAAMAPLPPLYDFTRDFSRTLPVSEDPASPVDLSTSGRTSFQTHDHSPSGGYGNRSIVGAGTAASVVGGGSSGSAATVGGGGGGSWSTVAAPGMTPYANAALLTNTVSVHTPCKGTSPSRIPGLYESYISYKVTSRSAVSPETTVDRRFRDVVALAELLQSLYPGCFLPPRPSRNAVEGRRMQPGFIEERRAGIERFLRRLVVHPVLGPSEATRVWLHSPTADLRTCPDWMRLRPCAPPGFAKSTARLLFQVVGVERTVPSPVDVIRPASERGDVYRLVHERAAQMKGVLQRVQPSPTEKQLKEEAATLQEQSAGLLALSRGADHLVGRSLKYGKVAGDLSTALTAEAEAEAVPMPAAAVLLAADALERVSKLYGVATDASAKHLTPMHEWLAAVPGATAALAARERCLLTLATLQYDEAEAKGQLAEAEARAGVAMASPPTAAMRKVEALRLRVSQLGVAVTAARDEYDRVGSRNVAEIAAFRAHLSRELADAIREYGLVQLAAAQKAHDIWAETAGKLATMAAEAAMAAALMTAGGGSRGGAAGGGSGVLGRGSSGVAIGVGLGGSGSGGMYGN